MSGKMSLGAKLAIGFGLGIGAWLLLKPKPLASLFDDPPLTTTPRAAPGPLWLLFSPPPTLTTPGDAGVYVLVTGKSGSGAVPVPVRQLGEMPRAKATDPVAVQSYVEDQFVAQQLAAFHDETVHVVTTDEEGANLGSWIYLGSEPGQRP